MEIKQETSPDPVKAKPKINPVLIYILVIFLGLAGGNYAYSYFMRQPKKALPVKEKNSAQPKTALITQTPEQTPTTSLQVIPAAASTAPAPLADKALSPAAELPTLVLNGIYFERGIGFALINNKIVEVGDEVEGARVKEITLTGVALEFEGKTIRLISPS